MPEIIIEEENIEITPPEVEIIEPVFEIISIVILQGDIVVTEFEAVLKITNPNEFAVELKSLTYKLFGNGPLWAQGGSEIFMQIPPHSSRETNFRFSMNFIDMRRSLLDDVIAMRNVNYRFIGHAQIQPILSGVSSFIANFDCSGHSEVKQ